MALEIDKPYYIQVIEDGSITFTRGYDNAVDAVNAYNKFVDYGTCNLWREIVLVEPNGKAHSKSFDHPLAPKLQVK